MPTRTTKEPYPRFPTDEPDDWRGIEVFPPNPQISAAQLEETIFEFSWLEWDSPFGIVCQLMLEKISLEAMLIKKCGRKLASALGFC